MNRARALLHELIHSHADGELRSICDFHFTSSGKALRPKLIFRLADTLSVPSQRAQLVLNWAVALEILHNATLIHDDLQDGDQVRRNQPTVWARFGVNAAINAGDFLLTAGPLAIDHLVIDDHAVRLNLHRTYSETSAKLVNGQSLEFEMNTHLSDTNQLEPAYWQCIDWKTSALFSGAARGVSFLAGLDFKQAQTIEGIFRHFGVLFQLQDDIVDIFGDKKRSQVACDLREGKVSCLVLNHLKLYPQEAPELVAHLHTKRECISEQMVAHWINRFQFGGALDMALELVRERQMLIAEASKALPLASLSELVRNLEGELLLSIQDLLQKRQPNV